MSLVMTGLWARKVNMCIFVQIELLKGKPDHSLTGKSPLRPPMHISSLLNWYTLFWETEKNQDLSGV